MGVLDMPRGIMHSFSLHSAVTPVAKSGKIRKRIGQVAFLNMALFIGFGTVYRALVQPWLISAGDNIAYFGGGPEEIEGWQSAARALISAQLFIFWMLPIYLASLVFNVVWCQDIADEAYLIVHGEAVVTMHFREVLRDALYRAVLFAVVTLQTIALEILPLVGRPLSFLLWSILYAYNSFEYKWSMHGLSLPERLRACEDNWAYMAGFGLLCTASGFFLPLGWSLAVYAAVFPIFVILAVVFDPPALPTPGVVPRARVFFLAERLASWVFVASLARYLPRRQYRDRRRRRGRPAKERDAASARRQRRPSAARADLAGEMQHRRRPSAYALLKQQGATK